MTRRPPLSWFTLAAVLGTVHAVASISWALGGDLLVETVGEWARSWREASPLSAGLALGTIGVGKLAAAWVPWVAARRGGPRHGLRLAAWLGAAGLGLYGLANTVAGAVALTGVLGPLDDPVATRGHVLLWDPLFLLWALALAAGLWATRERRPTPEGAGRRPDAVGLRRG
ncbi:DUF3995 domain-containing protein [Phycicoccus sp. HDW14]|uniref:DUF3995 domain-containing protein n=1 Tax=Phycicoccus sp. HDW14 TaxID=2714941 RepID=UPI00140DB9F7|nr:DUF3995 domain-containing protein [Phycicoccus sp. HDW14]QIM20375.1 DUF3995 domain-containing protein [Phycicoccus sp. HDW14]